MKSGFFKISLPVITGILLVIFAALNLQPLVSATSNDDECDEVFDGTKSSDFDDNRIEIDIQDFSGDDDRRVVVDPQSGYQLLSIGIDYTGSDANEANPSVGDGFTTITYDAPNNESIDHVSFSVKKVCAKVTICHATGSQQNPYTQISVNDDAVDGNGNDSSDHNRLGHQLGEDIIPSGSWDADGRNWNAQGQAIWNNQCNVPQPTPTPSPSPTPTPSPSPSPSVSPSPTPSPSPSPSPTPSPSPDVDESPSPSPSPSVDPSPSPSPRVGGGPTDEPSVGGNISTPQCPAGGPQKVDQVWFTNVQPNEVTVNWANKGDADGFQIAYGPSENNLIWGVEVNDPNANQFTLQNLPGGDLFVKVVAKASNDCGGPSSDVQGVNASTPQVLAATGVTQGILSTLAGLSLISLGIWQAKSALIVNKKRA